ncbi:hypothetical protein MK079_05305 [Candidatus Gracilibacteria bacterium]|nr:hypothetical protein [Candidatus Gracilibacteria bacterium]
MTAFIRLFFTLSVALFFGMTSVFAAGIDHFEITFTPDTAQLGESIDVEIRAVDKNNVVVQDYNGTILVFSETDPEVILPDELNQNTYTFVASDQGVIRFENAIRFQQTGTQDIHVYDLNDDTVFGIGEAQIDKKTVQEELVIDILSPQHNITVADANTKVSGTTQKNHQIKIIINDESENAVETTSNNDGIFEQDIELQEGQNSIVAHVLDADKNVIGTSDTLQILLASNLPSFKGLTYSPAENIETGMSVDVELIATQGLVEASIILNDIVYPLSETSEGKYTTTVVAPSEAGTYAIDVILKDELQHELNELAVASMDVIPSPEPELNAGDTETVATETIKEAPQAPDLSVSNLKVVELKSKSILTWDEVEAADSYNIYKKSGEATEYELVDNIKENRYEVAITGDEIKYDYFAVQAVADAEENSEVELYEGALSDATKVKTGPEMILLLVLSLLLAAGFVFMKKRA